jgi:hypothetical protein
MPLQELLSRPKSDIDNATRVISELKAQEAIAFSTRYYDSNRVLVACYFAERPICDRVRGAS